MAGQTVAKKFGGRSQRLVLFLGLVLAAIAAVIVFAAVNGADSGGGSNTVPVVQAKEAIPADTRITEDIVEMKFVSPDKADADAFTSRSQLIDRVVTEDVAAGAQVLTTDVSDTPKSGITVAVQDGYRSVAVAIQEVVAVGGNLTPGDHVDLVGIFQVADVEAANDILKVLGLEYTLKEPPMPAPTAAVTGEVAEAESSEDLVLTATFLQNVKLLALSQSVTETTAGGNVPADVEEADTEPKAATATLELTPQQAQEITSVDNFGIIRLTARAVGDEKTVEVVPTLLRLDRA